MERSVRTASDGDIPAITAIYRHAVLEGTASYEIEPPDESEMRRRFLALVGSGFPYLVAERDGQVLAYAYAGPFRQRPAYRWTVEDSVYVSPEAQGLGLGRMLLEALVGACETRGFRQLLAVIGGAHPASVALHERLGFQHAGRIEGSGFKHGRWLDTVLMQRALNGGTGSPPEG